MEIVSKRHPYKFYLLVVLLSFFLIGLGSIFIFSSIRDHNNKGFLISLVFLALAIYLNYILFKNSSKIILNKNGFFLKNKFHNWDEIIEIRLTGKSGLLFNAPSECCTITLKNNDSIRIFDDLYSNSSQMKYFIQEIVINKKETVEYPKKTNTVDIVNEFLVPYKGNPIFSFRGIIMWGLIIFFVFMPFFIDKPIKWNAYLLMIIFSFFCFFLNAWMMNYFEISKNYFVVKNHYFFWKNDIYSISDIKEIVFEQQSKQPNNLRIITNQYETKLYPAGSLTDSTWLEMKTDLENKQITVRNECISE